MEYELTGQATALRQRLRGIIAEEIPAGYLGAFTDDPADLEVAQHFCKRLAAEGLLTIAWPTAYGGGGGSVWDQTVVREEMWAHHEPRGAQYMGLNWVGPAIMAYGTETQKARFLPPIAAGEVIWCQGFSEPDAGSDLASLATRAVPDGDGFRVTGQKIWTSYAQMAQWCVLAARVGTTPADKHKGITIFLLPMDRPGITVRPIKSMLGPHHLNEVFFDDVQVNADEVLGGVGEGWNVIRRALAHERVGIARYARCDRLLSLLERSTGVPAHLRASWVRALVQVRLSRLLAYKAMREQEVGEPSDSTASAARLAVTQCDQTVGEVLFQAIEHRSLEARTGPLAGAIEDHWRYAQAATVASGTIEIQRMIVSRALLAGTFAVQDVPSPDAAAFGESAGRAFADHGDVDLARTGARSEAATILASLGIGDLDPRVDRDAAFAAAELCRHAGRVALPYPVVEVLLARDGVPFALVPSLSAMDTPMIDHGDLFPVWRVPGGTASPSGSILGTRLGPFVTPVSVSVGSGRSDTPAEAVLHLVLTAWRILGTLERAVELAVDHVNGRIQFGKPIASFQAVQFQLADAMVAVEGLRELCRSCVAGVTLVDALAARLAALDAARAVLRTCQQLHGAAGVCDEYDISVLTRHIQPALRLPFGAERCAQELATAIDRDGFASLFPHGALSSPGGVC